MSEVHATQVAEMPLRGASRLTAVDALRGLIIAFMALDHANHFVAHKHPPGEYWGEDSRSTTTPSPSSRAW